MSFEKSFHYSIPTYITFGPGTISELAPILGRVSDTKSKVLVVTMGDIPARTKIQEVIREAGLQACVFDEVEPNPSTRTVERAAEVASRNKCDLVIAVGGGSVIDAAKAAALVATNGGHAWDYTVEVQRKLVVPEKPVFPIIAVPTTAGTGAEVTQNSVLTNPDTHRKSPIRSLQICPKYAFVDPELTVTMPRNVTVATGFDAFTHAFEKALGPEDFPFIDALAIDAMRTVFQHLEQVIADPDNMSSRGALHWASTQAGLCVLAESWESALHVFSLPLSAIAGIPHGETLALTMPVVLTELIKVRPERVAALTSVFGKDRKSFSGDEEACEYVQEQVLAWLDRVGLNLRLRDYQLDGSDIVRLAESVDIHRLNASWEREVNISEVQEIYERVL